MDELAALRLQIEWGADEALADAPVDRCAACPAAAPVPRAVRPLPPARPPARSAVRRPVRRRPGAGARADLAALRRASTRWLPVRATATNTVARRATRRRPGADRRGARAGRRPRRPGLRRPAGPRWTACSPAPGCDRRRCSAPTSCPGARPATAARRRRDRSSACRSCIACWPWHARQVVLIGGLALRALAGTAAASAGARGAGRTWPCPAWTPIPRCPCCRPILAEQRRQRSATWRDLLQLRTALDGDEFTVVFAIAARHRVLHWPAGCVAARSMRGPSPCATPSCGRPGLPGRRRDAGRGRHRAAASPGPASTGTPPWRSRGSIRPGGAGVAAAARR